MASIEGRTVGAPLSESDKGTSERYGIMAAVNPLQGALMIKPTRLGHAVIRVRDLARSEEFYNKFLGLEVKGRGGDSMVFFRSNKDVDHDLAIQRLGDDAPVPRRRGWGCTT